MQTVLDIYEHRANHANAISQITSTVLVSNGVCVYLYNIGHMSIRNQDACISINAGANIECLSYLREFVENSGHPDPLHARHGGPRPQLLKPHPGDPWDPENWGAECQRII